MVRQLSSHFHRSIVPNDLVFSKIFQGTNLMCAHYSQLQNKNAINEEKLMQIV